MAHGVVEVIALGVVKILQGGPAQITGSTMYSIEFSNRCLVLACQSDVVSRIWISFQQLTTLTMNSFVNAVVYT